jgi:lipid-A-disaccharide synthase-like uncharacterized protein
MFGEVNINHIWLGIGIAAQALIFACIIVHFIASRRADGFSLPRPCIYICIFAIAVLAVYAAAKHDPVFLVGQILNLLIALRVLAIRPAPGDRAGEFPVVAPDRADADALRDRGHAK